MIVPPRRAAQLRPDEDTRSLPRVSVVVTCYGQLEYTKSLVSSLRENAGCEYDLLLVDNGCPERTREWASSQGVECLHIRENAGLPRAINAGAAAARNPLIALWNNDMRVLPHGLRRLARAAQTNGFSGQTAGYFKAGGYYVGQTSDAAWGDYPEGYCLVVRRDVWDTVGGWDPVFFPSNCDDSDWALRAKLKGYRFSLVADCVVHYGGVTTGKIAGYDHASLRHQAILRDRYAQYGLGYKILVQRWGALGDLITTTPALRGLRKQHPLSLIHVQCASECGRIISGLPYIDGVFSSPSHHPALYDRVVSLNGAYESGQPHGRWEHPVQAFCRVADVPFDERICDVSIPRHLQEWGKESLPYDKHLIAAGLRSAYRPKQNWRASSWLKLADALPDDCLLVALDPAPRPALSHHGHATPEDHEFYAHGRVLDLTGSTQTIEHAGGIIANCKAFAGVDSGLLHVASGLGVPVINLNAAAPLAARLPLAGKRFGYEGRGHCFPCQYPSACPHVVHCLDWVSPEEVARKLVELCRGT